MMFILGGRFSSIAKYRFPLPERAKNNFTDVHKDEDDDEVSTIGFFFYLITVQLPIGNKC